MNSANLCYYIDVKVRSSLLSIKKKSPFQIKTILLLFFLYKDKEFII